MGKFHALLSKPRNDDYLCGDFVIEAWKELFGRDLPDAAKQALSSTSTKTLLDAKQHAIPSRTPLSPSIVTFWRSSKRPHVGLYYKGNVWHLARDTGQCVPFGMLSSQYPVIRFYGVKYG